MTENQLMVLASDFLPDGVRDLDDIESEMVLSEIYGSKEKVEISENNFNIIQHIYEQEIKECNGIPTVDSLYFEISNHNAEKMKEIGVQNVMHNLKKSGADLNDICQSEFAMLVDDQLHSMYDFYSYNGQLDEFTEIRLFAEKAGVSYRIASTDEEYSRIMDDYDFSPDHDQDIVCNPAQQVMFYELFEEDGNIAVAKCGPIYNMHEMRYISE